ncbi:MAG: hypothetical protein ACRD22_17065, partial [Terriglobia bacterium]
MRADPGAYNLPWPPAAPLSRITQKADPRGAQLDVAAAPSFLFSTASAVEKLSRVNGSIANQDFVVQVRT